MINQAIANDEEAENKNKEMQSKIKE